MCVCVFVCVCVVRLHVCGVQVGIGVCTGHRERSVCVCLTIFVSVFSAGTDASPEHLDMLAAGAAVELVDAVLPPAHGVSHTCLVFHMNTEVNPIHAKHLLEAHPHTCTDRHTHTHTHTHRNTDKYRHSRNEQLNMFISL